MVDTVKPKKDSSMLIDIQYVKPSKANNQPDDYLYIIWRDMDTGEKHLMINKNPVIPIYFEKEEYRDHDYCKNYAPMDHLVEKFVPYRDVTKEIACEAGGQWLQIYKENMRAGRYGENKKIYAYPYTFGSDYDPIPIYRAKWLNKFDNDRVKKLHKGFLDIEVDGIETPGMPSAQDCPVNAVTLIDGWDGVVYTFLYVGRQYEGNDPHRKEMYANMHAQQKYMITHTSEFNQKLHETYDDFYGSDLKYKQFFYTDEKKMLVHLFQLINQLKLDFIAVWNISFDIPYLIERLTRLGLDPKEVMCHPDFPAKVCYFKKDDRNFEIKNKNDTMILSSYTNFIDQMELYAANRKGASELRSYKLNFIAQKELKDTKLDYSDEGNIKTLPYENFEMFVTYNIKDVLLQYGIERRTCDMDTLYVSSYKNATPYAKVFKQTVVLRNVQYVNFLRRGLVPGNNINVLFDTKTTPKYDDEGNLIDEDESFEGALVADPTYNDKVGIEIYGQPSNNIFLNAVDFDMSAFYPSSIRAMNIDPSTLIFKMQLDLDQYDIYGGEIPLSGITWKKFVEEGEKDGSKEFIDNFQTGNYPSFGSKWLNMPSVDEVFQRMKEELGD